MNYAWIRRRLGVNYACLITFDRQSSALLAMRLTCAPTGVSTVETVTCLCSEGNGIVRNCTCMNWNKKITPTAGWEHKVDSSSRGGSWGLDCCWDDEPRPAGTACGFCVCHMYIFVRCTDFHLVELRPRIPCRQWRGVLAEGSLPWHAATVALHSLAG
jgi:hypothetical protein